MLTSLLVPFREELYREYLEEVSFLTEELAAWRHDPGIAWHDLENIEARMETFLDGLIVGGDLGRRVCQERAEEGDPGELHGALRVLCRYGRLDLGLGALPHLGLDDPERARAAVDALKLELPESWQEVMQSRSPVVEPYWPVWTETVGFLRLHGACRGLCKALEGMPEELLPRSLWALGRLEESGQSDYLRVHLYALQPEVRAAAAMALLRLGDEATLRLCLDNADASWAHLPLALAGGRSAVAALSSATRGDEAHEDTVLALGLLGDLSAIKILIGQLGQPAAGVAALSLQLITGANLVEEVEIPQEVDEAELFPSEREKLATGEFTPPSTTTTQLSEDPAVWSEWWEAHRCGFDPKHRYRFGEAYSPAVLVKSLAASYTPAKIRQLTYEELCIRYDMSQPFETDMSVASQRQAIKKMEHWAQSSAGEKSGPGAWS